MSNYTKATNFYTKDALSTGNPSKIIKGAEIDDEFNAISTAVNSKADITSPTFTGTPLAPTATAGTNTTQIATTAFVAASQGTMASQNKTAVDITGGTIVGITDLLPADGGTGVSALTQNALIIGNGTGAVTTVRPSTNGNVLISTAGATVTAGSFVVGTQYTILTLGTTNFTSIGADSSPAIGEVFIATGAGTGTGTATINVWTSETVDTTPDNLTTATGSAPSYSARAWGYINGSSAADVSGTYSQSGTTVTVTLSGHGLAVGHYVQADITSGTAVDGLYAVTAVSSSSVFTYTAATSLTTSGNITLSRRAIVASGNVANVTYVSAGVYIVNFTTAMANASYAPVCNMANSATSNDATDTNLIYFVQPFLLASTNFRLSTFQYNGAEISSNVDVGLVTFSVFK